MSASRGRPGQARAAARKAQVRADAAPDVLRRLGAISVTRFMREAWQRKPLLIRAALGTFSSPLDRDALLALARQPDVEARLIEHRAGRWTLKHAPLARLPALSRRNWTVLVQGVDGLHEGAHALLQRFRFLPDARLDDIMMSYATDGGGVGPHVDSYDVFLLQAEGRRRWRISRQRDLQCVPGVPLQLLSNFRPTAEYVLDPGDLLYLPPGVAHEGTALGECVTISIGFRAPTYQELLEPFLSDCAATAGLKGRYADRGLTPTRHPAALPAAMVLRLHAALNRYRPRAADMSRFLLSSLSEPKAQVVFDRPRRVLGIEAFGRSLERRGVVLDRRTRMLYRGGSFGINGERHAAEGALLAPLQRLADRRVLGPGRRGPQLIECLHEWYRAGWLHIDEGNR
jgi:50S ribosomal protein L16 3-hydroxylase